MKEMERIVKGFFFRNMFISMFFLVVGLIMVFCPTMSATFMSYIFGTLLIANGVSYLLDNPEKIFYYDTVLLGMISIILGMIIFLYPEVVSIIVPITLGVWFIISGMLKFEIARIVNKIGEKGWGVLIVTSIFTVFAGMFMFMCPKLANVAIVTFSGVFLVFYSLSDIINYIYLRNKYSKLVKYFK